MAQKREKRGSVAEDELLGVQICKALGISPDIVQDIVITIPPATVAPISIELSVICIRNELDGIDWKELLKDANVTVIHTHCGCGSEGKSPDNFQIYAAVPTGYEEFLEEVKKEDRHETSRFNDHSE